MECVFISGESSVGKTTFAKDLAKKKGYACYVSSGGKNPLDDYKDEECIILDDLRDDNYGLTDFLKLCDNNTDSLVGCRFYNKSIFECRLLIVTSIKTIQEFYNYIFQIEKEPRTQLYRRFKTMIKMEREFIRFYNYDEELEEYVFSTQAINYVSSKYDKENSNSFTNEIIDVMKLKEYKPKSVNDLPF